MVPSARPLMPAGLAAVIAARKTGLEVVADGFEPPIDKACGEGLLPATLQALKRLGVRLNPCDGYPFHGIRFADHHSTVEARFFECSSKLPKLPFLLLVK